MTEALRWKLYNQGKTDKEIAKALGMTPGGVGAWRSRRGLQPMRANKVRVDRDVLPTKGRAMGAELAEYKRQFRGLLDADW